jgi:hypothetical protein
MTASMTNDASSCLCVQPDLQSAYAVHQPDHVIHELRKNPHWPVVLFADSQSAARASANLKGCVCAAISRNTDLGFRTQLGLFSQRNVYVWGRFEFDPAELLAMTEEIEWDLMTALQDVDAEILTEKELLANIAWQ